MQRAILPKDGEILFFGVNQVVDFANRPNVDVFTFNDGGGQAVVTLLPNGDREVEFPDDRRMVVTPDARSGKRSVTFPKR